MKPKEIAEIEEFEGGPTRPHLVRIDFLPTGPALPSGVVSFGLAMACRELVAHLKKNEAYRREMRAQYARNGWNS